MGKRIDDLSQIGNVARDAEGFFPASPLQGFERAERACQASRDGRGRAGSRRPPVEDDDHRSRRTVRSDSNHLGVALPLMVTRPGDGLDPLKDRMDPLKSYKGKPEPLKYGRRLSSGPEETTSEEE